MMTTDSSPALHDVTADMLVEAFKPRTRLADWLLRVALAGPTRDIASHALKVEAMVQHLEGQQAAARWLMDHWGVPVTAAGLERVPTDGPLVVVSNHAGWGDAIALWAALPRRDIHTVVKANGLLRAMPTLVSHMIVVQDGQEMTALRRIIHVLREERTVLLYPRGEIEPDPNLNLGGALASLEHWTPSIELIARKVPGLRVLPVAVGGVLDVRAQNHPIARLYRKPETREFVGATLQLMLNMFDEVTIDVHIGEPIPVENVQLAHVRDRMADLLLRFDA